MKRHKIIIFVVCGVVFIYTVLVFSLKYVVLPINSSPYTLTLVNNGASHLNRVILRHYVNDVPIADYGLEINVRLERQVPHQYELPQLDEGKVEIFVEFDTIKEKLIANYENVGDVYKKGLLIYLESFDAKYAVVDGELIGDRYVYFVSGAKRVCYLREAYVQEWSIMPDAPKLKWIIRTDEISYSSFYNGWKEENKWVIKNVID